MSAYRLHGDIELHVFDTGEWHASYVRYESAENPDTGERIKRQMVVAEARGATLPDALRNLAEWIVEAQP